MIRVEVAYASPAKQNVIAVEVSEVSTIADAILQSGILQEFPEINLSKAKIGVFGKLVTLQTQIQDGDRIEIYRPLIIDPKQARLLRTKKKKG